MIQCRHLTCHACACAGCAALLDELDALRAERDQLQSHCDVLETVAENRNAAHVRADKAEVLAWRTATGCDTPAEAAEARRRWEAEDAEQAAELARLRELEAAVLELDASSGGDDVWDLDGSDEERRARAAIAACRAARKPPGPAMGRERRCDPSSTGCTAR